MDVDSGYAEANGVRIYYEAHGKGTPLVMIHGWGFNSEEWGDKLIKTLAERNKVILMDNRGTGKSTRRAPITIKNMADDTHTLIKHLYAVPANVFGYSMGGFVAQQLAIDHPETINKIIVGATAPGGPDSVMGKQLSEARISEVCDNLGNLSVYDMWNLLFSVREDPKRLNVIGDRMAEWMTLRKDYKNPTSGRIYFNQFKAMMETDVYQYLSKILAPTLILAGEKDEIFPLINSKLIDCCISYSKLSVIENGSHAFLFEKMDEVTSLILEFLKETGQDNFQENLYLFFY